MKSLLPFLFVFTFLSSNAQYTTPGTGVNWNMDSLVLYSGGVVWTNFFGDYLIGEDIIVSENDSLFFTGLNIQMDFEVSLFVSGYFEANHPDGMTVSDFANSTGNYGRLRFEESAEVILNKVTFINGGGLKVISPNFNMDSCTVENMNTTFNTGGAIELSNGNPIISNSTFSLNESAAISSAANAQVSPIISNNTFQGNNTSNSNRPQINMGPSETDATTTITGNTIIGNPNHDQVGGIAFSSLFGTESYVLIENNTVEDNRYGIAVIGNGITATIKGNSCINNNTQNDPMLGGSGINFNATGSSSAIVSDNTITGNLWGITIQGSFEVNLGDGTDESPGHNSFDDNGNNDELFALYNNTPNPVSALDNCWISSQSYTLEEAEDVIFHQVDDLPLGLVSFDPMWNCNLWLAIEETDFENELLLYPNPTNDDITLEFTGSIHQLKIFSLSGKLIYSQNGALESPIRISISDLIPGVYFVELVSDGLIVRKRVVKL